MSAEANWSLAGYSKFVAAVAVVTAVLIVAAYPLAGGRGEGWLGAVVAACLASALASALAGALLTTTGGTPQSALNRFLIAMLLRLVLVAAFAAYCLLGLGVAQGPFVLWLVVSYLALLAVDTVVASRSVRGL